MDWFLSLDPILLTIIAVQIILFAILFLLLILSRSEIREMKYRYLALEEYLGNGESRDLLQSSADMLRELEHDSRIKGKDISDLFEILSGCVQKVAILRYNAFNDVGSDLSYSIALLDYDDNGIVISGLYGRETSTTYAKPIEFGHSQYILTEEEEQVISLARKKHLGKTYFGDRKESDGFN
ncbi:MAG: DUF4446 family protein [Oscillospiraceae bacterium]|nr:DUF4446 family protein [Oscillospiraceae bacterium]